MLGLDVIGATTLGPRGRNILVGGGTPTPWDNNNSYSAGDAVYSDGHYYRAVRDVSPPFMSSIFDGDVPGKSDAWREITQQQAYPQPSAPVLGVDATPTPIDVAGLKARLDSLPHTNREVWDLWVTAGHGAGLAQRVAGDAQKLLDEAIIPTAEFNFHDQVMLFSKTRFEALDDKVTKQPMDDNPSPVWSDVASYLVDGSNLANLLEGVSTQTMKWTDVKDAANQAAKGAGNALDTAKWVTYSLIGGAVLLGVGALYAIFKIATSQTGGAIIGGYLGTRRR